MSGIGWEADITFLPDLQALKTLLKSTSLDAMAMWRRGGFSMKIRRSILLSIVASLTLGGCVEGHNQRVSVGEEAFELPDDRTLYSDISFLPSSQNDGLRFYLDAEQDGSGGFLVSVQDAALICNLPGAAIQNYRSNACTDDNAQFFVTPFRRADVEHSGGTLWEYYNSAGLRIAVCAETSDGAGSCTAYGRFETTIFAIHFTDNKIGELPTLIRRVVDTLDGWHVRSGIQSAR